MTPPTESDPVRIGDLQEPDMSFDERFEALFEVAYRVAFRITGSREEASDIAQESLARAAERWPKVSSYAEAWVARVAGNLAISYWRWRRRRQVLAAATGDDGRDLSFGERIDLVRALQRLPRRQRQVVVLRYLSDRSEAEVAAVLGISVGSVKSQASRGLDALRLMLDATPTPGLKTARNSLGGP